MATYRYPDLTIVNEDDEVRARLTDLDNAILALHPKHQLRQASVHDVVAAIQRVHHAVVDIHDVSLVGSDFLLKLRDPRTYNRMLAIGHLSVPTACLVLEPWNAEHGCVTVPANTQQRTVFGFKYSNTTDKPRQFRVQVAGIPPQLCSPKTIHSLLGRACNIQDIQFEPTDHTYIVTGETHHFQVIPPVSHLGLKSIEGTQAVLQIWPIWCTPVGYVLEDEIYQWHVQNVESVVTEDQAPSTSKLIDDNSVGPQDTV